MVKTRIRGERNLIPIWIHKNSNGTDNGIAIPDLPNGLQHRDHLVVSFKWIPVRLMVAKSSVEEPGFFQSGRILTMGRGGGFCRGAVFCI